MRISFDFDETIFAIGLNIIFDPCCVYVNLAFTWFSVTLRIRTKKPEW